LDEIGLVVYEELSFKVKVYGRRTKSDHKSSPCHFVTGELKSSSRNLILLTTLVELHARNMPAKLHLNLVKWYWRSHLNEKVNARTDGLTDI
jgi:hypothetical protein